MSILSEYLSFLIENKKPRYYFYTSIRLHREKIESPPELKDTDNGNDIYKWLVEDAGLAFDQKTRNYGKKIKGDPNIWYLCMDAKLGQIEYKNLTTGRKSNWRWFNKSNPDRVKRIIDTMYYDHVFTYNQHKDLIDKIDTSKQISYVENIPKYLGEY